MKKPEIIRFVATICFLIGVIYVLNYMCDFENLRKDHKVDIIVMSIVFGISLLLALWDKNINEDYPGNYTYITLLGTKYIVTRKQIRLSEGNYKTQSCFYTFNIIQVKELGFCGKLVDVVDLKFVFSADINIFDAKYSKEHVKESLEKAYTNHLANNNRLEEIKNGEIV